MQKISRPPLRRTALWRACLTAAPFAGILLAASACSGTSDAADPPSASPPSVAASRTPNGAGSSSSHSGGTTAGKGGGGNSSGGGGQGGSVGTYTVAFAKCMRAHGIPKFPDPNGRAGQLGPSSGIDPGSARFRDALDGPCKSLAPPAWVDSGKASVPGGGS
ncbi:hypothetical protein [Actinomadura sp. DC4]|uniref:hypothetical protein n=1 Tax=Actinomadura sp. DC4 TaxID=3055069 RepID=UPI0025B24D68|nr:hypothetical protein [Actinomadura sp. DC4]MDN3356464.1 hypothetical protein [Actinomadura sp. DC4]